MQWWIVFEIWTYSCLHHVTIYSKIVLAGDFLDTDVKTVEATIFSKTDSLIIALASDGLMHKMEWNGRAAVYKTLKPGDIVTVHYYPGFNGSVVAFEAPPKTDTEALNSGEDQGGVGYEP